MPLWKPNDLGDGDSDGCKMWVRPETLPSSGTITTWQNDGKLSWPLTGTKKTGGTAEPTATGAATLNGYSGALMNSDAESYFTSDTDDGSDHSGIMDVGTGTYMCYIVARTTADGDYQYFFGNDTLVSDSSLFIASANGVWTACESADGTNIYCRTNNSSEGTLSSGHSDDLAQSATTGNMSGGKWDTDAAQTWIVGGGRIVSTTRSDFEVRINGTILAEKTDSQSPFDIDDSGGFFFGNNGAENKGLVGGTIWEGVVIHGGASNLGEEISDLLDGYLSWKYNTALPDDVDTSDGAKGVHAYKNGPPTTCHCVAQGTLSTNKLSYNPTIPYNVRQMLNIKDERSE
tara:strand:- start:13325 stop:14359 length:1035 start_codon:yes stop_codon:yes gene_type:complete